MACCNRRMLILSVLVLVASSHGVHAQMDPRDVVRDTEGQIVHATNGTCVRTKWLNDRDICAPQPVVVQETVTQRTAAALTQEERTVYFEFDHSDLTQTAKDRLDTLADVLKSDQTVKEAKIVGYADRIGTASYNKRLSQKRAETVRSYLTSRGYLNARSIETRWVGKSKPATHCPPMKARTKLIQCLQDDRRVEVEIVFNPPSPPQAR